MTLGEYLKNKNERPSAFADRVGVWPSTVSRWLKGHRLPGANELAAIERCTDGLVRASDFGSRVIDSPQFAKEGATDA